VKDKVTKCILSSYIC